MNSLISADIFFFVTTIALILITAFFIVALVYLVRVLKDASHISKKIRDESDEIIKDVSSFREKVREKGFKLVDILGIVGKFIRPKSRIKKANSTINNNK